MLHVGFTDVMPQHGIKKWRRDANTVTLQYLQIKFDVLPNFEDGIVFKGRAKNLQDLKCLIFIFGNRDVPAFSCFAGERNAHEVHIEKIKGRGFRIKTEFLFRKELIIHSANGRGGFGELVFVWSIVDILSSPDFRNLLLLMFLRKHRYLRG